MQDALTDLVGPDAVWTHVSRTDDRTLQALRDRFSFHELDLRDIKPPLQRPKLVIRDGYLFMILLFPYYQPKHRDIWITEVDVFVGKNSIVTVNDHDEFSPLKQLAAEARSNPELCTTLLAGGISAALYRLLDRLHQSAFPMLVHISQDIDDVEEQLFEKQTNGLVEEILRIKTNIVDFRRAMQGHKPVLEKLLFHGATVIDIKKQQAYWNDLIDVTKEIWAYLETQRETIGALHETHASLLSHRISEVMKRLTLVSVVLLPLTLVASLFGMNVEDVPFGDHPYGFWIIVVVLFLIFSLVHRYFKSRDWV